MVARPVVRSISVKPTANLGLLAVTMSLLGLALILPLGAEAQSVGKVDRIGVLWPGASPPPGSRMEWFRQGLRESGYVEGQNVAIVVRHAEGSERLRALATELVQANVRVIATFGDLAPSMAQQATSVVPIIAVTDDFLGTGLVSNLARPGGNITGVTIFAPELSAKRLALLKEIVPKLSRVAVLWDTTTRSQLRATEDAAPSLKVKLQVLDVRSRDDLASAFEGMKAGQAEALAVFASPLLASLQQPIIKLAAGHRLPAIYPLRVYVDAGGLVSYGPILSEMWRQSAAMVSKILKGAKPAELPIEQPTRFELVINMKTAKALGLAIPNSVRLQADHIIE
jgi:putative tryptophan/tyrosine transport system substrate-binding protein